MSAENLPQVSIIIPTYNEAQNLPLIVPRISAELERCGLRGEIIVVDDDSPDGTGGPVAEKLAQRYPLRALVRKGRRGLATAVLEGFSCARAEVLVVMDADGSHPPEKIGELVRPILQDQADIVVASRNLPGGGSDDWPWYRRLASRTAAFLARPLCPLSDPTSGFMAVRRSVLDGRELKPLGYKIVLEVVVRSPGARLAEIPFVFQNRQLGQSKFGLAEQWRYSRHLWRLYQYRFPEAGEFVRFCLVGLLGLLVDMAVVVALRETLALDARLCAVFGFLVAVSNNYIFNRYWTFPQGRRTPFFRGYVLFVSVCLLGLAARLLVTHLLIEFFVLDRGRWYIMTNFIGIVTATMINFLGAKYLALSPRRIVFRKEKGKDV